MVFSWDSKIHLTERGQTEEGQAAEKIPPLLS